ncbi:MAG: AAA family ATPase [Clostridia bacterium]|nr:AAA family ATPase [Clostridia bacterium]
MDITLSGLTLLHQPDDIIEIRSIDPKPVISGYFRADSPAIAHEIARYPNRTFYQTMNPVKSACYAREQHERLVERPRETTSDNDIVGYQWILIDADPVRPSGVSASKNEKEAARRVAGMAMKKLMAMGFSEPVVADSGNGYHLLFKIHAGTEERQVLSDFLSVLDMWFSTDAVKIDTAVFNPARITKLYGTVARKGASTLERPHRQSSIIRRPADVKETPMALVRNIAGEKQKAVPTSENPRLRSSNAFNLDQFLSDYGIQVIQKVPISSGMKYQLAECPFDPSHKHGDAAVFAYSNGSFGFHCFHSSCASYHWHEFREKVDPDAYVNSPRTGSQSLAQPAQRGSDVSPAPQPGNSAGPRMLDFAEIPNYDRSKIIVVRSRFQALDNRIGGFNRGEMSVWSGGNASGKSTLVSQIGLAAVTEGCKVAMFSGEMTASRVREWVLLQAAGPDFVMQDPLSPNHFCLKPGIEQKLDAMLTGKLSIYDNDFGTDWERVTNTIYDWVRKNGASVVIIDNLMALDIPTGTNDKYDMQSRIAKRFSAMAKELNVHVHFICHPRKTEAFLRKGDISGTADLTNVADNVFMVHRVNADFMMRYKTVYPKLVIDQDVSTVIEIMKNRDLGVVDEIIKLYFDRRSRTLSDVKGLPPQHAWTEKMEQITMQDFTVVDNAELPAEWR